MEAIQRAALVSVGRACGFGGLAIMCVMTAASYEPAFAARLGGIGTLIMTGVLVLKAVTAMRVPYKHTETWLMLAETDRPRPETAQTLVTRVLREVCLYYARLSAATTLVLFAAAFLLALVAELRA